MRNFGWIICVLILSASACKPTAEESTTRISRAWQINKYYENNNDMTAAFKSHNKNFTLQFYADQTFLQSAVVNDTFKTRGGNWYFNEQIDSLYLETATDTNRFYIRLLRQKNLNIREIISTTTYDYLLVDY